MTVYRNIKNLSKGLPDAQLSVMWSVLAYSSDKRHDRHYTLPLVVHQADAALDQLLPTTKPGITVNPTTGWLLLTPPSSPSSATSPCRPSEKRPFSSLKDGFCSTASNEKKRQWSSHTLLVISANLEESCPHPYRSWDRVLRSRSPKIETPSCGCTISKYFPLQNFSH
ncbi:hypothetical protein HPP92_000520 [Vanilla planifolia]|uniref:Uncharacterized protein n=1 Tax=Vanilla planifolia TaxID=51239 RepID=A0A835SAV6_VANPL|nr:hypothetical protein HPP92_000520 [Vanilla planifolia]